MASLERSPCGLSTRATLPLLGHLEQKLQMPRDRQGRWDTREGCFINSRSMGSSSQTNHPEKRIIDWKKRHGSCEKKKKQEKSPGKYKRGPGHPERNGLGLLTCQLVSGRPEICIRNMVRRGRGTAGRSCGPGKFSLRRGPRANCTVSRSPLKSLPSVASL